MRFLLKYKLELRILLIIIGIYFLLRLPNLTLQPIFADEAIYIRWAQVMRSESTLRFLPLSDGKTPLFMWTLMPVLKFIEDPLFAGRFLSVMSGLATLLGVFVLSWKVFSVRVALWSALIYAVVPYTVFFDRMALVDSMLSAFTIWAVFFAIWLAQSVRLDLAMILGFILGGAWLTKTPAFLNLLLLPLSILAFQNTKSDKYRLLRLLLYFSIAAIIALGAYNLLRLGPGFHLISSRNTDYVFALSELQGRPLDPFIPHFNDILDWFPSLLTVPILVSIVIGSWFVVKQKNRLGLVVLLWALVPLLISMAFLKTFTARYLLPPIPLLLIFAGYGVEKSLEMIKLVRLPKTAIALAILLVVPLHFNYQLLTSPPPTSLPKAERAGYFEMWTAGYGLEDIANYLIEKKNGGSVVVGTEGFFGTLPDGLYIYLDKSKISVVGSHASISAQIKDAAKSHQTFFVGNKNSLESIFPTGWLIKEYPKTKPLGGTKQDSTVLYQVLP